jgi:hypothetical protein
MSNFIEVETFTANNSSYTVLANDCFILINANGYGNCSVILLSNSNLAKSYIIKETSGLIVISNVVANTVNVTPLIITTDNSSCLIDSSASVQININFGSLQVISVPNGSYITI